MTSIVESLSSSYKYLFEELCNPLTRNMTLCGSPFPIIAIVMMYSYFCTRIGPQYMNNRKPYKLKNSLLVYNMLQVLLNFYMCYEATIYLYSGEYNFMCQNVDDPSTSRARKAVEVGYLFYMVKCLDLLDTVFFVLRKSHRQITTLHLHHHMLMPIAGWIGMTYFPGGSGAIIVYLNSFVHTFMYSYYLLAGLGEEYKKYLWWKKYVTILQLVQFCLYALHSINSLFYDCGFPFILKYAIILYSFVFIYMFGKFYYNAYVVKHNKTESKHKVPNGTKTN